MRKHYFELSTPENQRIVIAAKNAISDCRKGQIPSYSFIKDFLERFPNSREVLEVDESELEKWSEEYKNWFEKTEK